MTKQLVLDSGFIQKQVLITKCCDNYCEFSFQTRRSVALSRTLVTRSRMRSKALLSRTESKPKPKPLSSPWRYLLSCSSSLCCVAKSEKLNAQANFHRHSISRTFEIEREASKIGRIRLARQAD